MFQTGDYVVNASNGICQIKDIVQMDLSGSGEMKEYFLLVPIEETTAKIYIPVDIASQRIRPVITRDEAWMVIRRIPEISETPIANDKEREKTYKDAILSGDPERLIGIIKNMYYRKQTRNAQGKKCTAVDERYFKLAENHLYAELAFAIGENRSNMQEIINNSIKIYK